MSVYEVFMLLYLLFFMRSNQPKELIILIQMLVNQPIYYHFNIHNLLILHPQTMLPIKPFKKKVYKPNRLVFFEIKLMLLFQQDNIISK